MDEAALKDIVGSIAERGVSRLTPLSGGSFTSAQRYEARLADGRLLFIKAALDAYTAQKLRSEYMVCKNEDAEFMPKVIGWHEAQLPILIRESVVGSWPPPWNQHQIVRFGQLMDEISRYPIKSSLPTIRETQTYGRWKLIAEEPEVFLNSQRLIPAWATTVLPKLVELESRAVLDGDQLVHLDLRGDNICFTHNGVKLIDWDHGCRGNHEIDVIMWRINLYVEDGPAPWTQGGVDIPILATMAGFFAHDQLAHTPTGLDKSVRRLQAKQYDAAMEWLSHASGLDLGNRGAQVDN